MCCERATFFFGTDTIPPFWRDARAAESARLESVCGATHRGFESHSLRQPARSSWSNGDGHRAGGYDSRMTTEIRNNEERSRYELEIDGRLIGIAEYRLEGETVAFPHTEIERARRGQGLGAHLVQYALDDVRA